MQDEHPGTIPLLTVSDFIAIANQTLEYSFGHIAIEGEVSSFKVNQSKFVFFDLRDEDSSINCFMMLFNLRIALSDGMRVRISAIPKLTSKGKFSLTVTQIYPIGTGSIKKNFDLLRAKLSREGLFDPARKRPLLDQVNKIAIISSIDAAGYADFIKTLDSRWGGLEVDVAHVQVQGDSAPDQIISALNFLNQKPYDAIAIIRGGGSRDDLAAFDDEPLVRAIAASKNLILTGIGHETDTSLADLAADLSAHTPTAAAQLLTPDKSALITQIHTNLAHARTATLDQIDLVTQNIILDLPQLSAHLHRLLDQRIAEASHLHHLITQLNPENILRRGYAILTGHARAGEVVNITTHTNIIQAEVKHVKKRQ